MKRIPILIPILIVAVFTGAAAYLYAGNHFGLNQQETTMQTVTSKDGTKIAYDKLGSGHALILIGGAIASRSDHDKLAQLLSAHFTVYNYDRRGRGDSGDTKPYAVAHEIEDINALIDEAGGSAYLFGRSSGACLALEAAATLGNKVKKLALYEAPYDETKGVAEQWRAYRAELDKLLTADRHGDAVELHMKYVGVPATAIAEMKASPGWPRMKSLAPTIAYDVAILGESRSIPAGRAALIKASTLVMDGGASLETMPFMRVTADKLGKTIPNAKRSTLEAQGHNPDDKIIAPVLTEFFQ